MEDGRPSRTTAVHRQEQRQIAAAAISGNDVADNHNHKDYQELLRPDHRHLRDQPPFIDATEHDSDAATGRDSTGAVDQRRCHLDNRSKPTLIKRAVNVESADQSRPRADRAATSDSSTNGNRGRGRGQGTPLKHVRRNRV